MKKIGLFSILAFVFSLLLSGTVVAGGMTHAEEGKKQAAVESKEYTGLAVIDQQGENIGTVSDVQRDEDGAIRFIVLESEGKDHLVPFAAFESSKRADALILSVDENLLASAPSKMSDMSSEEYSRELYEHYGLAPYWGPGTEAAPED